LTAQAHLWQGRRGGWKVLLGLVVLLSAPGGVDAQGRAGTSRADYRIDARLDGETMELGGKLTLRWTNGSGEPVQDLWFHLYHNAFSNNRSTHLVEAGGELRGTKIEEGWGWQQVESVRASLAGEDGWDDLFPTFKYRRPDDDREDDRTVFSVDLPRPVGPDQTVTVQIEWRSQLPRVRRRTGYKDDFILAAHWFPKLGVYEAGRGWNAHQFHANTEFYADYGTYDVSLDLPAEYEGKVWASGVKSNETLEGGRLKVKFDAPSKADRRSTDTFGKKALVHGFAWTADSRFVPRHKTFRYAEWAENFPDEVEKVRSALGPDVDIELRDVDITVLIHPERIDQVDRHFRATEAALFFYGLWFGEYPYQHVTVVDPAWGAGAAGGMEYPTLFTCGTRLFTTEDMYQPESVTVHEAGHQFWYGLVGNNEFEAAFLDEGFNSYTDAEVMHRVYGSQRGTTDYARLPFGGVPVGGAPGGSPVADALIGKAITIPLPFLPNPRIKPLPDSGFLDLWRDQPRLTFVPQWTDPRWGDRARYLTNPATDPLETFAYLHADRQSYGTNSYPRTAVALRSLPAVVGYDNFLQGMRHYSKTWRYAHPYPADFYAAFQEGAGVEIDWYFRELFQGTGTVDWSVAVEQERRPTPKGFFQSEGGAFFERAEEEEEPEEDTRPWVIEIDVRRKGTLRLPVPVRLTFEDGSTQEVVWTREEQKAATWKRIELESDQKLTSVQIDPDRSYYLDMNMADNSWHDESGRVAPWRWGERVLSQYQRYLHWIGGFGG
jgi:hypothetical protein